MLVEGQGSPQNDLDSFKGPALVIWVPYYDLDSFRRHLLVGSPIMISVSFRGHLLIESNFFSLLKLFIWDLASS